MHFDGGLIAFRRIEGCQFKGCFRLSVITEIFHSLGIFQSFKDLFNLLG